SGIYIQNLVNANGCDSTLTLHLTINESTTSELFETACDSFTLNDETFTESGIYIQNLVNANGCDSTLTLHLTINESTTSELFETACDSLTINDITYFESGTFTQNLVNAAGCDSTLTLHLTINESSSSELFETACDSLTINDITYFESGTFTQNLVNVAGCDSTLTLHLTINRGSSTEIYETAIESFSLNGETFNESGIYIQNLVNITGCDSILILNLTINEIGLQNPQDDYYSVGEGSENNILQLLENDDFDENAASIQIDNQPIRGNIIINDNNTPLNPFDDYLLYTPASHYYPEETFTYTIIDKHGKTSTAVVYITIIPNPLFIPEGFSPNGDGINDLFIISGLSHFPNNSIVIFDKNGQTVFQYTDYQNNYWDGKNIFTGEFLPQDTYFYILNLGNGATRRKGFVYLIR
ncbi:MAG: gliding motility-associated C-terminal domain-containing protein, partial [Bacteroidales bacterium]|nr:gliding motility-associated C-terminal domain-containing protein [Bacteroidales bacterium]